MIARNLLESNWQLLMRLEFTYNGSGQPLVKSISVGNGEIYQYGQNGLLLEETHASGVAQADYIYLEGWPIAVLNGSTPYYLHDDNLGTPQMATDSSQAVQWQASSAASLRAFDGGGVELPLSGATLG